MYVAYRIATIPMTVSLNVMFDVCNLSISHTSVNIARIKYDVYTQ